MRRLRVMFPTMVKVGVVIALGLALLSVAVNSLLVHVVGYGSAPHEAQRLAVEAVERQRGVTDVDVVVASRSGDCAVVVVKLPDADLNGPSVSLDKVDGRWHVRRIGEDFDSDSVSASACP